jgi:hypothetical protein
VETLDVGAQGLELFDDAFVSAVDVVDAVDEGFAFGDEGGEN